MKKTFECEWCGTSFLRYECQSHRFCSRECLARYRSKAYNPENRPIIKHPHLSEYNREHNAERMTPAVREKIRQARIDTGSGKSYRKVNGRHEHRAVAEQMLGRRLLPGEVVHHINRDKRDNRPENLMIFASQAEHAKWHKEHDTEGR